MVQMNDDDTTLIPEMTFRRSPPMSADFRTPMPAGNCGL
jgi:hypothetical protein